MARVRTVDFLPEIFQTSTNKQFLAATLDQLVQEPKFKKTQGYVGRKVGPGVNADDRYVIEPTNSRTDYQLEPGVVIIQPDSTNIQDAITYPGISDALKIQGANTTKSDRLYTSEYYAWDSFSDFDKFSNYAQYYWLPAGPLAVDVYASTISTSDNYTVTRANGAYTFSGVSGDNPALTLVRGGTYTFDVTQNNKETINYRVTNNYSLNYVIDYEVNPTLTLVRGNTYVFNLSLNGVYPFWIKTEPTLGRIDSYSDGVLRNGTVEGNITFTVPQDAPDTLYYISENQFNMQGTLNIVNGTPGTGPGFWIQAEPGISGTLPYAPNISSRDVLGVSNNGEDLGTVTFDVPEATAQSFYYELSSIGPVDLVTNIKFSDINNQFLEPFIAQYGGIDGITGLEGRTVVFLNDTIDPVTGGWQNISQYDPLASVAPNTGVSGSYDTTSFSDTVNIDNLDTRYSVWQIQYVESEGGQIYMTLDVVKGLDRLQKFNVLFGTQYASTQWYRNSDGFIEAIPLLTAVKEVLYYQDGPDPGIVGEFRMIDPADISTLDIFDIIGKKNYTSPNGIVFTNGLKVQFRGNLFPTTYQNNQYYVEGVGTAIALLPVSDFVTPETYTKDATIPFDSLPFDVGNYDAGLNQPLEPDYITISRNSLSQNAWSRSNRWFHLDVINYSALVNGITPAPDNNYRAKRPIIEFRGNLRLHDMGTKGKQPVDIIDFYTVDAFSSIEGTNSYSVDGYTFLQGTRVIFANDTDPQVRNKIYEVNLISPNLVIEVIGTSSSTNEFEAVTTLGMSINMPITFTGYMGSLWYTILSSDSDTSQFTTAGTSKTDTMYIGMPITFNGSTGGVYQNTTYYVASIVDDTHFTVSVTPSGPSILLETGYSQMIGNAGLIYPEQQYYVREVVDETHFKISSTINGAVLSLLGNDDINHLAPPMKGLGDIDPIINLVPATDADVLVDENTVCLAGTTLQGKSFYFDGVDWIEAQEKTSINQPPLFNVYDTTGISFSNSIKYPASTFVGSKLFNYAVGSGAADTILGFPLRYLSLNNIGDIVFDNSLYTDTFTYSGSTTVNVSSGFVRQYSTRELYLREIGWQTAVTPSLTRQQFQFSYDGAPLRFDVKVVENHTVPAVLLYVGSEFQTSDTYTVDTTDTTTTITLNNIYTPGSIIEALVLSNQASNTGFYQVPINLENNPFNVNSDTFTLGTIRGHYDTMCQNLIGLQGPINGPNNSRDLGNIVPYGLQILQQSSPMTLAGFFMRDQEYDIFKSLAFNDREYTKFKSRMLQTVVNNEWSNSTVSQILDAVIVELATGKNDTNSFYWSDMIPAGAISTVNNYTVTPISTPVFDTVQTYNFTSANYLGLLVYKNQQLLMINTEYVVSVDGPTLTVLVPLVVGDVITVREFSDTAGTFVPNTPTKMGLYQAYRPRIFYDTNYVQPTLVIQGHDGSITLAFGDIRDQILLEYELRVYNNLKTQGNPVPLTIESVMPGYFRTTDYTQAEITSMLAESFLTWVGWNKLDYQAQYYEPANPFTYNYSQAGDKLTNKPLLGAWRGINRYFYDTLSPNTTPWEMVGLTEKPAWWELRYGPAPYTADNLVLWDDMAGGIVADPDGYYVLPQYVRTNLSYFIPNGPEGELLSPLDSVVGQYNPNAWRKSWIVGDGGPVEASWWMSSSYPFAVMRLLALTRPAEFFSLFADRDLYKYDNELEQYLYNGRYRLDANGVQVYGNGVSKASYLNWIVDYNQQLGINSTTALENSLQYLDVRLCYRMASFTDKQYLKIYTERSSPNSLNTSLLLPDESYRLPLYKNTPFADITYSAVIVQLTETGYTVLGYSTTDPYFDIYASRSNGQLQTVEAGGSVVRVPTQYYENIVQVPYGFNFINQSAMVDFLLSYGKLLETQGLTFINRENGYTLDWMQMAQEFLYWANQGWEVGSIINLNPCAGRLVATKPGAVVDNISASNPENLIIDQNRQPIDARNLVIERLENTFSVTSTTSSTISYIKLKFTSYEHMVILDNLSIFNDLIYDPATGARQSRINIVATTSTEWNGTLDAQGFILNEDNIKEWKSNMRYPKGEIVLYKNTYWSAQGIVQPKVIFDYNDWLKSDYTKIQRGLLPNIANKAYQLANSYNTQTANLEGDNDLLSYGLIGFRPRQYMSALNLDDTSQVNLYQQFLGTKGTVRAAEIFTGANLGKETAQYDIYENWAIKRGTYGANANRSFYELRLNEALLQADPSTIQVTLLGEESLANQTVLVSDIWRESFRITSPEILPTTYVSVTDTALPSAGYVNVNDVDITVFSLDDPSVISEKIDSIGIGTKIWVAKSNNYDWDVYRTNKTPGFISQVSDNLNGTSSVTFTQAHNLVRGDLLIVRYFNTAIDGVYRVLNVSNQPNMLTIAYDFGTSKQTTFVSQGIGFFLQTMRVAQASDVINLPYANNLVPGALAWVDDNGSGHWEVLEKQSPFSTSNQIIIEDVDSNTNLGTSATQAYDNIGSLVGAPGYNSNAGAVYGYTKNIDSEYVQSTVLTLDNVTSASGFGNSADFGNQTWAVVGASTSNSGKGYAAVVQYPRTLVHAGSFNIGTTYTIVTLGTTDFIAIGAANNAIGEVFTATGTGTGTGTAHDDTYTVTQLLIPNPTHVSNGFGFSVTISRDERWIYVGAPTVGSAASKIYAYGRVDYQPQSIEYVTDGGTTYNYSDHIEISVGSQLEVIVNGITVNSVDYDVITDTLDEDYGNIVFNANVPALRQTLVIAQKSSVTFTGDGSTVQFPADSTLLTNDLYTATITESIKVMVDGQMQRPFIDYELIDGDLEFLGVAPDAGADIVVSVGTYWMTVTNIGGDAPAAGVTSTQYGYSVKSTTDGRQVMIGAPLDNTVDDVTTGAVYVVDRSVHRYLIENTAQLTYPLPASFAEPVAVMLNNEYLTNSAQYFNGQFTVDGTDIVLSESVTLNIGDTIEIESNNFSLVQKITPDTVYDDAKFGATVDVCPNNCSVYIGAPYDGQILIQAGSVNRQVNQSRVYGVITSPIANPIDMMSPPVGDTIRVNNYDVALIMPDTWTDTTTWSAGTIVVDGNSLYRAVINVPTGIAITDMVYWNVSSWIDQLASNINNFYAGYPTPASLSGVQVGVPNVIASATSNLLLTGDGTTKVFGVGTVYSVATSYTTLVYNDNVLLTSGADYNYNNTTEQITFTTAPANASVIVVVSGRLTISIKNSNAAQILNKVTVLPGLTGTVFDMLGFDTNNYVYTQTITSPSASAYAHFGQALDIDTTALTLVVGAPRGNLYEPMQIDDNKTYFDDYSTTFFSAVIESGVVYTYDYLPSSNETASNPGKFVFGQQVYDSSISTLDQYGTSIDYTTGRLLVGSPGYDPVYTAGNFDIGTTYVIRSLGIYPDQTDFTAIGAANNNIGTVFTATNVGSGTGTASLDSVNYGGAIVFTNTSGTATWTVKHAQQPVVDVALLNSVFMYDKVESTVTSYLDFFNPLQGKILGVARQDIDFIGAVDPANYNNGSVHNFGNPWHAEHVGQIWWDTNSVRFIDPNQDDIVYASRRWGQVFPGSTIDIYQWIESVTPPANYTGPGTPLSAISYTTRAQISDTGVVTTSYYFWVRNISTVDTVAGKKLSTSAIASYIENPRASGIAYLAPLNASTVAIYNVLDLISAQDTILHVEYDREATDNNVHIEYELITQDQGDSFLSDNLYLKLQDSFSGYNLNGLPVPNPNLSPPEKYGVDFQPRQSMFENRFSALQNYLSHVNNVLKNFPIVETRKFNLLNSSESEPTVSSGAWNKRVADLSELYYQNLAVVPIGYKYLVVTDSEQQGEWAIYTVVLAGLAKVLELTRVQSYDTSLWWNRVDWYQVGYNSTTTATVEVTDYADLATLLVPIGSSVKVTANAQNKFEIYLRTATGWDRVGLQDGTIKFDSTLWAVSDVVDLGKATAIRKIIQAINEELLVDDLLVERNRALTLMFSFILSEFTAPDWLIKTSLVDVNHRIRDLLPYQIYRQDNQDFVLNYIQEVKPYHVQIREFNLIYNGKDAYPGLLSDFDVPAYYNTDLEIPQYVSPILTPYTVSDAVGYGTPNSVSDTPASSLLWTQWPWSQWHNNYSLSISDIEITSGGSGYTSAPDVIVTGDCITPAVLTATVNSAGVLVSIAIDNPGVGYTTTPVISFAGGNGTGATAYALLNGQGLGQVYNTSVVPSDIQSYSLSRAVKTTIKYDRYQYESIIIDWEPTASYLEDTLVRHIDLVWQANANIVVAPIVTTASCEAIQAFITVGSTAGLTTGLLIVADGIQANTYITKITGTRVDISQPTISKLINNTVNFYLSFNPADWTRLDADSLSGVDRTMGFYVPTVNLPGLSLPLLIDGVDYPGVQVSALSYPVGEGFDATPYDVWPFDNISYGPDGDPTYDIGLLNAIYESPYLDPYLGVRSTDINVDGGAYVDTYSSHAPEELVPGAEYDTLDIRVYTTPGADWDQLGHGFKIDSKKFIVESLDSEYSFAGILPYAAVVMVSNQTTNLDLYLDVDYTVDWNNGTVSLVNGASINDVVVISVYEIGGGNQLFKQVYTGAEIGDSVVIPMEFSLITDMVIFVNGATINSYSYAQEQSNTTVVTFDPALASNDYVLITAIGATVVGSETTDYNWSTAQTEYFAGNGALAFTITNSLIYSNPDDAIITVNGLRARGSAGVAYIADGTYGFGIGYPLPLRLGFSQQLIEAVDVRAYVDDIPQVLGVDYEVEPYVEWAAGQFVVGTVYIIETVGTTDFVNLGANSNTVGQEFLATKTGNFEAGDFIVGRVYTITTIGTTDFTLIGATSNTVGQSFVATGDGTGDGTADQGDGTASYPRGVIFANPPNSGERVSVYVLTNAQAYIINGQLNFDPLGGLVPIVGDVIAVTTWNDTRQQNILTSVFVGPDTYSAPEDWQTFDSTVFDSPYSSTTLPSPFDPTLGQFDYSSSLPVYTNNLYLPDLYLTQLATNPERLWVTLNGQRLFVNVDFTVVQTTAVFIVNGAEVSLPVTEVVLPSLLGFTDVVIITEFTNSIATDAMAFRIFQDMRGVQATYRITPNTTTYLTQDLSATDLEIHVYDASALPAPVLENNIWGILTIGGERIMYRNRDVVNNIISGIRRGTAGTGAASHISGSVVYDMGRNNLMPEDQDYVVQDTFVGNGSTTVFTATSIDIYDNPDILSPIVPNDAIEVYVGGFRITEGYTVNADNPVEIEFDSAPAAGVDVTILVRRGTWWYGVDTEAERSLSLQESQTRAARFLRGL